MTASSPDPYDHELDGGLDGDPVVLEPPAEPVATSNVLQLAIGAAVASGWFVADDPLFPALGTAVGAVIAVITLLRARGWVKPWPKAIG